MMIIIMRTRSFLTLDPDTDHQIGRLVGQITIMIVPLWHLVLTYSDPPSYPHSSPLVAAARGVFRMFNADNCAQVTHNTSQYIARKEISGEGLKRDIIAAKMIHLVTKSPFMKSMLKICDWSLRLHTVMESEKICVLDKGRLVEQGSPKVSDQTRFFV